MKTPSPNFGAEIERLFPEVSSSGQTKTVFNFTFQVTTDCSLRCTYCYQINKGHEMMTWEMAKKTLDYLFANVNNPDFIVSYDKCSGIVFDFIGGEPLLNIDLVLKIIDYVETWLIETKSPWLFKHKYSFSSNGVAYFSPKVQEMMKKYSDIISLSVTVDGYKELHDKCRLFPDGSGSYDAAITAALTLKDKYRSDGTKITLCPENIMETSKAIINMLELGYKDIFANCVFEEGWDIPHAKILYQEMKKLADYILDNDLQDSIYISLFGKDNFSPLDDTDTQNWCGGTGKMLAIDFKGDFYPCIRYMESSIGTECKPLIIGNIDHGVYVTDEEKQVYKDLTSITRQSQSTEECLKCPIAKGCAWCSGYNYQKFGTANKRATFICTMHKARALANYYYWKEEAKKLGIKNDVILYLPKEEALKIIDEKEWKMLTEGSG